MIDDCVHAIWGASHDEPVQVDGLFHIIVVGHNVFPRHPPLISGYQITTFFGNANFSVFELAETFSPWLGTIVHLKSRHLSDLF